MASRNTVAAVGVVLAMAAAAAWWWSSRGRAEHAGAEAGAASAAALAPGAASGMGKGSAASSGSFAAGGRAGAGRRFATPAVQPVSVDVVRRQDIRVRVNAIGSLVASNTAIVRPQVSGVLQALHFKEGQTVRAGQSLAQIDPRPFEASLAQVNGTLARDQAQLANARVDLERYRALLAQDAVARQQVDTQEALVRQLEATLQVDRAAVDSARLQLSYTRVVAPIGGRAGLKQADLGNVVQPGDASGIVSIAQTRPIALLFAVPAANLPQITARMKAGDAVPVEVWDRGNSARLASGRLATLDNAIDPATDTIKLKALLPNAEEQLFPNQSVNVTLQLDTLADTLAVPGAAVLRGAQGFYVYVVNADGTVGTRNIKPGPVDGSWTAVTGDLRPGERVVIDGTDRLREGARVEVIAADPSQRAGAASAAGRGGRRGARGASGAAEGASGASWARGASGAFGGRRAAASEASAASAAAPR